MAVAEPEPTDYSKRNRILNALEVYPDEYRMSNRAIAELTGASASYVYQLRTSIDEGELDDDEIESALDDGLQARYRDRLRDLLADGGGSTAGVEPAAGDGDDGSEPSESAPDRRTDGTVPIEDVEHVRGVMARYREDAAFERERFEGSGKNVAEEKYFIANRAVELLDRVIDG